MTDIQYVDDDVTSTANRIIAAFEAISGSTLFPADPRRLFLLSLAQIITQQRALINSVKRADLLRYASGDVLDAIGDMFDTPRLPADAARTTIEFRLSMPLLSATIIPAGTRIGVQGGGGTLYFATSNVLEIPAGSLTASITAECSTPGVSGIGFLPGQLNVLIDPLPYVQSVKNTTTSAGGAEAENDDAYRDRIRSAPGSYSVAGPEGAYRHWAKTASSSIIDVGVDSPAECEVVVVPLLAGGQMPTQDILDAVAEAVNDRKVRPLTDRVMVTAPTPVSYNINLTYWIARSRSAESASIQTAVVAAVEQYRTWQKSKLGRDINPSELIRLVMEAGAMRVNVVSPAYTDISALKVAQDAMVNVVYGGLADGS